MEYNKVLVNELNVKGKVVFLRLDLNVPVIDGEITSFKRINASIPTIEYLVQQGAKVVILSHMGRVKAQADIDSGKITEVFGCGTAAVISPVGELGFKGKKHIINNNKTGTVSKHLYDELTGIQYGTREDKFGWIQSI